MIAGRGELKYLRSGVLREIEAAARLHNAEN